MEKLLLLKLATYNMNLEEAMRLLNHGIYRQEKIYTTIDTEEFNNAIELIQNILNDISTI